MPKVNLDVRLWTRHRGDRFVIRLILIDNIFVTIWALRRRQVKRHWLRAWLGVKSRKSGLPNQQSSGPWVPGGVGAGEIWSIKDLVETYAQRNSETRWIVSEVETKAAVNIVHLFVNSDKMTEQYDTTEQELK